MSEPRGSEAMRDAGSVGSDGAELTRNPVAANYVHTGETVARFVYPATDHNANGGEFWPLAICNAAIAMGGETEAVAVIKKSRYDELTLRAREAATRAPDVGTIAEQLDAKAARNSAARAPDGTEEDWTEEEWQLDQAVQDAKALNRPDVQIRRLESIRDLFATRLAGRGDVPTPATQDAKE